MKYQHCIQEANIFDQIVIFNAHSAAIVISEAKHNLPNYK